MDDYFYDWESEVFGFGYGTGEEYIIPELRKFIVNIPLTGTYDYRTLEIECGHTVAWLFINMLCHARIIEYGTSPRYGWLSKCGKRLKEYLEDKTPEQIFEVIDRDEDYRRCYPNACNCGENGYEEGRVCQNPFWVENLGAKE